MPAPLNTENWYLIRDRKKIGPIPWSELRTLVAQGKVQPRDMLLGEGQTRWVEATSIEGLFPGTPTANGLPAVPLPTATPAVTIPPPLSPSVTLLSDRQAASTRKQSHLPPPINLPGYEILEELGRGGMGVVYKARQAKASRVVALKMILSGAHAGTDDLTRFQTEAEAVARLQHPHIIQVYEVGEHEGRPYFSLEYCGGGSLDLKLRENPLVPREAGRLVEVLARAMHHAHGHQILHRDLKPANVLLTDDGTPKITDFGLAKKLDESGQTASGAVMGTPSYMSPEQASGKAKHLTAAADVYALGAILYDCLAGRPPFRAATPLDTILQVITDAPVPPAHLNPKVPPDLQTICLKSLEKNPAHRYATAEDLAEDLRRFTNGEPIQARPAGWAERLWKWSRRRPAAAALLAVSLVGALTLLIGGVYFTTRLSLERNEAVKQRNEAEQQRERAERGETDAQTQKKYAEERATEAQRRFEQSRRSLFTSQVWRAAGIWDRNPLLGRDLLNEPRFCPPELRDFAWGYYQRLCTLGETPVRHPSEVNAVAISPDGTLFATACSDSTIKLWELPALKEKATLRGHKGRVNTIAFNPKGDILASGGADRTIKLWEIPEGKEHATLKGSPHYIQGLAFTYDGKELLSGTGWEPPDWKGHLGLRFRDGEVRAWDLGAINENKSKRLFASDSAVICLATSPTARLAAVCLSHASVTKLLDLDQGKDVGTLNSGNGWNQAVAFSPDGQTVAVGISNHLVFTYDVKSHENRLTLRGHQTELCAMAFSPDGRRLVSGSQDGAIKFWDPASGKEQSSLSGRYGLVNGLAFAPDSHTMIAAYPNSRTAVVWGVRRETSRTLGSVEVLDLALRADGNLLVYGANQGYQVHLRELPGGKETLLDMKSGRPGAIALAPDGKSLAVGVYDHAGDFYPRGVEVQVWDTSGTQRAAFAVKDLVDGVALTSTGQVFAVTAAGKLLAWDVNTKKEMAPPASITTARGMALSPDGQTLALGVGRTLRLLDLAAGTERARFETGSEAITRLAFSPDGKMLAAFGALGAVRFWGMEPLTERTPTDPVPRLRARAMSLAFTPDNRSLALGCTDRTVRLLDVETGEERAVLSGHSREVTGVAFKPDGRMLISGSGPYRTASWVRGGEIKFWDAAPYR